MLNGICAQLGLITRHPAKSRRKTAGCVKTRKTVILNKISESQTAGQEIAG
jgi:hypothetical protein